MLLTLIGISLASAPLVGVLVTLGLREDFFPGMRGALLRSGGLAISLFIVSTIAPLLGLSRSIPIQWATLIGLGIFSAAVGSLIPVAIIFAQVSITIRQTSVLLGRFIHSILWSVIFLLAFAFMIVIIRQWGWASIQAFVLMGFVVGYSFCGYMMRDYMKYGMGNFKECFSASEFYNEIITLIQEASELRITATTPGLILVSEYDPEKYPMPGERKNPNRKRVIDVYIECAKKGVQIKYLAGEEGVKEYVKRYKKFGIYNNYKKASLKLFSDALQLEKLEVRTLQLGKESKFAYINCISDQAVAFSTRDRLTRNIKHGDIVKNSALAKKLAKQFDSANHWGAARNLTLSEFQKIWTI